MGWRNPPGIHPWHVRPRPRPHHLTHRCHYPCNRFVIFSGRIRRQSIHIDLSYLTRRRRCFLPPLLQVLLRRKKQRRLLLLRRFSLAYPLVLLLLLLLLLLALSLTTVSISEALGAVARRGARPKIRRGAVVEVAVAVLEAQRVAGGGGGRGPAATRGQ